MSTERVPVFQGAGVTVVHADSAADVLKQAGLNDWNVRTEPVFIQGPDGQPQNIHGRKAVVRNGPDGGTEVFDVVSHHYQTFQNEELVSVMDTVADVAAAQYDTAGSFRGGRRVFVSLLLPGGFKVAGMDTEEHKVFLLGTTTHDGKGSIQYVTTPVRVVCQNTLSTGLKSMITQFNVRHKGEVSVKVQQVRESLELQHAAIEGFQEQAERMLNTPVSDEQFAKFMGQLWTPSTTEVAKRREAKLDWLWHEADTVQGITGTRWGAYQVVTEYTDHYDAPTGTDYHRAARAADGAGLSRKEKAFALLSA